MLLNKIYNKVARHTVVEILSKAVFTCKSGTQLCNTINFICYKKRKKKKDKHYFLLQCICTSVLSLLFSRHGAIFFTGHCEAGDEWHKFFKVQDIIFVLVQILHDMVHGVGILLGLKQM